MGVLISGQSDLTMYVQIGMNVLPAPASLPACLPALCLPPSACLPVYLSSHETAGQPETLRGTALRPGAAQRGPIGASPLARATLARETPRLKVASRARFHIAFVPVAFMGKVGAATGRWRGRIERGGANV